MAISGHTISFDFDLHELDEDLQKVVEEYPDETLSFLRKSASRWKKDCNDKGYGNYTGSSVDTMTGWGKRKKSVKPIGKMWKNTKEENILHQYTGIEIQNKSNIFHLLENGHRKFIFGHDTGGFVAGKHWAEQTREEWKETFPDKVSDFVKTMLGRHNL